jgi:hypothetical protein
MPWQIMAKWFKPQFVTEIKEWNKSIKKYDKPVIIQNLFRRNHQKIKALLKC